MHTFHMLQKLKFICPIKAFDKRMTQEGDIWQVDHFMLKSRSKVLTIDCTEKDGQMVDV